MLEEIDPIGRTTTHSYDENGNQIFTYFVDRGIRKEYQYDLSNRLIKEIEVHPHASYVTSYRYDLNSRKIATLDPLGNETLYGYDDLGRIITVTHPLVNRVRGLESFEYDIAGNKTASYDVLGNATRTTYNARNQPICITYPDGSQEHYQYNSNGTLAKHTAPNGVTTITYYDSHIRPARKTVHDKQGHLLYETYATFNGTYLASETDADGIETRYSHDGAGRIVQIIRGNHCTQYAYDHLGREYKTIEWGQGNSKRITTKVYDYLDRITEEQVEDQRGTLLSQHLYSYDCHGNLCQELSLADGGFISKTTEYDTRNRPIRLTDKEGRVTLIAHDENYLTGMTTTTRTDPQGNQIITIQNSIGQITEETTSDGHNNTRSTFFYDIAGRKIRQCDTTITPGFPDQTTTTEWAYDNMGRVIDRPQEH